MTFISDEYMSIVLLSFMETIYGSHSFFCWFECRLKSYCRIIEVESTFEITLKREWISEDDRKRRRMEERRKVGIVDA